MSDDEAASQVSVYIYDLTAGLANSLSSVLLGKQVDGIWHTGIVAFGREYFFGATGVQSCAPGGTILGEPTRVERIGETEVPYQLFLEYIFGLGESSFVPEKYNLIEHNCNNFADEVATFLCGHGIPKYILTLPDELLNTPLGQTIAPLLAGLSLKRDPGVTPAALSTSLQRHHREDSPDFVELNQRVNEIREQNRELEERRSSLNTKLEKFERKKQKRESKTHKKHRKHRAHSAEGLLSEEQAQDKERDIRSEKETRACRRRVTFSESTTECRGPADGEDTPSESVSLREQLATWAAATAMSDGSPPPPEPRPPAAGAEEPEPEPEPDKPRIPPITFKDVVTDVLAEFSALDAAVGAALGPEEQQNVAELKQYLLEDEGAWALGENFINFLGRIFHDKSLPPEGRVHLLRLLSVATLKDDFILILHQDRREHVVMNYAEDVDRLPAEEQAALSLLFCNMYDQNSSSEWLLYISEWQSPHNNMPISNIRVTTKVAVNALLSDSPEMQERGTAIMYNLAVKEVFDDVATELAMAILQYYQKTPCEEHLYRCMCALDKFAQVSYNDVPQLIKMIGPEPSQFRGQSARADELIDRLELRLKRVQM